MLSRRLFTTLTIAAVISVSAIAWAQNGTISGTITDSSGAVVPGAQVTARDVQTDASRATTTNAQGYFEFVALKPSTYELTVAAKGFEKAVKHDVRVVVGLESHLDVALTPGSVSETVEVKGEIPLIEPDKTNVSYSIETAQIESLPLQGRNSLIWRCSLPAQ